MAHRLTLIIRLLPHTLAMMVTVFALSLSTGANANHLHIPSQISFQDIIANKDLNIGEVDAFLQDSEGYMWFGGGLALIRYDGYEFRQVDISEEDGKPVEPHPPQFINDIFEDAHHKIWIASRNGLLLYDGKKEKLIKVKDDKSQSVRVSISDIFCITQMNDGSLLVGSRSGLLVFNTDTYQYTSFVPENNETAWPVDLSVYSINHDKDDQLWMTTALGLMKVDWKTKNAKHYRVNTNAPETSPDYRINFARPDGTGKLWVATSSGVVHFDPQSGFSKLYAHDFNDPFSIAGNDIRRVMIDSQGLLWICGDGSGVSVYDSENDRFINYKAELGRPGSLNTDKIRIVYEDKSGDIWVGNYPVGVHFFDRSTAAISTYTAVASNPNSLSNTSVLAISEDKKGNFWIGTDGGGLNYFNRETNQFTHFRNDPRNTNSINGDSILTTLIDSSGLIWVGTWGSGISSYNPTTKSFTRYPIATEAATQAISESVELRSPNIWTIKEDKHHNLWMGTHYDGLIKFNPSTQRFTRYATLAQVPHSLSNMLVGAILEDSKGELWIGTSAGLNRLNPDQETFTHFFADPKNPTAISSSNVISIFEDRKKRLWVGTNAGLNLFDRNTQTFKVYNKSSGLLDETIFAILEDNEGTLWLSTNKGFTSFNPDTQKIKNFNRIGGQLMGGFGRNSGILSSRGEVIFGGVEGLRIINPHALTTNKMPPPVALTDLKIFADSVPIGGSDGILKQAINHTDSITLDYTKSMFAFSFAALNFRDTEKNQYRYKLEGFDRNWLNVGNQRTAKYTNLDAGDYVFTVTASNNDGVWNETGASVKITVLPPIWKSWVAYVLYALTVMILGVDFVRAQRKKLKEAQRKIQQERALNERMKNLDQLKENFLANTSHELRTPLNGIIGLAESIKTGYRDMPAAELEQKAAMILYSGKRLANVVNDILEFSQLANNQLALSLGKVPLHLAIAKALSDLKDRLSDKPIQMHCDISKEIMVFSNEYRLIQIIHHILDNAIKFTREGSITITHEQEEGFDKITVADTGIGIAPEHIGTIFSAFQQIDGSAKRTTQGAGLGLSVIQKLIELHKGKIDLESEVGVGTSFHIYLPTIPEALLALPAEITVSSHTASELPENAAAIQTPVIERSPKVETIIFASHLYADEISVPPNETPRKHYKILIVDDDPVNRMVVKAHLRKQQFETAEAIDGEDALKMINEQPDIDLIVLDIMMPRMTGHEVCDVLRRSFHLHQLPIIFLTANQQPSEAVKAFSVGGNDFITKPVSGKYLVDKVNRHLALLEESRALEKKLTPHNLEPSVHNASTAPESNTTLANTSAYLPLSTAVSYIVDQLFALVPPIELAACWLHVDHQFECVHTASSTHALTTPVDATWLTSQLVEEAEAQKNSLIEAAQKGRMGEHFSAMDFLTCELIVVDNYTLGFILMGAQNTESLTPEHHAIITQCGLHLAAAVAKNNALYAADNT